MGDPGAFNLLPGVQNLLWVIVGLTILVHVCLMLCDLPWLVFDEMYK